MTATTTDTSALIAWLDSHDEPCPACAYNLRGLTADICPECGTRLTLAVDAPDLRRIWSWLIAAGAFTLGLGFDAISALVVLSRAIVNATRTGTPPPHIEVRKFVVVAALALFSAIGLAVLLRARGRWVRMSASTQWLYAITIFTIVGMIHLVGGIAIPIIR